MNRLRSLWATAFSAIALVGTLRAGTPMLDPAVVEFRDICHQAMERMMSGMSAPSADDVDHDFVQMMVPHHQAAIDMAMAELKHGKNEQLRRVAQEIIVDQQQEMAVMNIAIVPYPGNVAPQVESGASSPGIKEPQ